MPRVGIVLSGPAPAVIADHVADSSQAAAPSALTHSGENIEVRAGGDNRAGSQQLVPARRVLPWPQEEGIVVAESGRATSSRSSASGENRRRPACAECRSGRTGRHLWVPAAVPGHRLAAARWLSVPELVVPVRKACRSGILAESGERLAFRHDLIRDAEQASIPAAARALDRHGRQGTARPQSPVRRDCDAAVQQRESRDGKTGGSSNTCSYHHIS